MANMCQLVYKTPLDKRGYVVPLPETQGAQWPFIFFTYTYSQ